MKRKGLIREKFTCLLLLVIFALISIYLPSTAICAPQVTVTPRISLEGYYDTNIDLDPNNEKDDYILVYSSGVTVSYFDERKGLDLDYELGVTRYQDYSENNITTHDGTLNAWYNLTRHLAFSLRDNFRLGNDPRDEREETVETPLGELPVTDIRESRGRNEYWRNTFNPDIRWEFGRGRYIDLAYTNSKFDNDREDLTDSMENVYGATLGYRFNVRNNLEIQYDFTDAEFDLPDNTQPSEDFIGHDVSVSYTYAFTRHTYIELHGTYMRRIYDSHEYEEDYDVEDVGATLYHSFSPTFSIYAGLGYFWRNIGSNLQQTNPSWELGITKTGRHWTFNSAFEGGYRERYIDRENLGYEEFWSLTADFSHNYHDKWINTISGSFDHERIGGDENNTRSTLDFAFTSRYNITRWLSTEFEYDYLHRNADVDEDEYRDHRVFLRLIAYYDIIRTGPPSH